MAASMGPRHYRRGNRPRAKRTDGYFLRFNGAATLSSRKSIATGRFSRCRTSFNGVATLSSRKCTQKPTKRVAYILASMGPRHYSRGNDIVGLAQSALKDELQWGRDIIVAEILYRGSSDDGYSRASMGPRHYRRGNRARDNAETPERESASMGPRHYRRGNGALMSYRKAAKKLQWGRDIIVAEISLRLVASGVNNLLQWGRDIIVAEMHPATPPPRATQRFNGAATLSSRKFTHARKEQFGMNGFNGAATLSSRKSPNHHFRRRGVGCASMGPRHYRRGNFGDAQVSGVACVYASMGPRHYRRGNHDDRRSTALHRLRSFNGAATLSSRKLQQRCKRYARRRASMGPRHYRRGNRSSHP